jgi:adiponectin receptor
MERFACVDYTGISLLIAASIMTTEYTAFYCEPVSRWIYLIMTAMLGIGGVILPWHPTFNRTDMKWARIAFFVFLGATGLLPMIQLYLTRGLSWTYYFYSPIWKSVAIYLLGACAYGFQVPERFYPGAFDYVGGSHNIWHISVLLGIVMHFKAVEQFFAEAFSRAASECQIL